MKRSFWSLYLRLKFHLFQRGRFDRLVLEQIAGHPLLVLPGVFNPALFLTSEFMVTALNAALVPPGCRFLDMGTGSGVGAIFAARWTQQVVAVDINPAAVRCARINALLNEVESCVDVRLGDLFLPVAGERFDVILFNPPYYRGEPHSTLDRAFHATDVVERFVAGLPSHLLPGGHALVLLSTAGDQAAFLDVFRNHGFASTAVARRDLPLERLSLYRIVPSSEPA